MVSKKQVQVSKAAKLSIIISTVTLLCIAAHIAIDHLTTKQLECSVLGLNLETQKVVMECK
jgi:hypothetical protein